MALELKEVKAKADDYLHQLSFVSRVRDVAWVDGLHLGFEMFRTWWKDPSRKVDLDKMLVEDVPCTSETMRQLTSLSREEMPDAAGIAVFDYHPLPRISRPPRRAHRPERRLKMPRLLPLLEIHLLFLRFLK